MSEATVSRVLNNVGPMKEETKRRVLQAAEELGYVPSALAQQFARRRSGNIGVILPFVPKVRLFTTYYFSEILSGIGEAAQKNGHDLLLIFKEQSEERDYAALFRKQKIDSCVILGSKNIPEERAALSQLAEERFPFCLVNQRFEEEDYMTVDADHAAGSYLAVRHMLDNGYSRIAFINGPPDYSNSSDRLQGYRRALEEAAKPVQHQHLFQGNYSRTSGYELGESMRALLQSGEIDAVFAANDRMAIGLQQYLKEAGLEAGIHYGLAGYDDSDSSRIISPLLTTVAVPFYEMGSLAVEKLLRFTENRSKAAAERHSILPVQLVIRESSEHK